MGTLKVGSRPSGRRKCPVLARNYSTSTALRDPGHKLSEPRENVGRRSLTLPQAA
jgi:hypothetical protein